MKTTRQRIETALELALRPGEYVGYEAGFTVVHQLEGIAEQIDEVVRGGEPGLGAELYESFIAACQKKAEEFDPSGGGFGDLVAALFGGWVRARDAAGADPAETMTGLVYWMDEDEYGFSHRLEETVTAEMSGRTLEAFAAKARERICASAPDDGGYAGYPRRRWTGVLKETLRQIGDPSRYLELCGSVGFIGPDECDAVTEMLDKQGDLAGALTWAERGLACARDGARQALSEFTLRKRRLDLLVRLGRREEAIAIGWSEFEEDPGGHSCKQLMDLLPGESRSEWHDRAMNVGEKANLETAADLFMEANEHERLARRITGATDKEIEGFPSWIAEDSVEAFARSNPGLAARLYRSLALPILRERRSRLYPKALRYLRSARDCYIMGGRTAAWEELAAEIRQAHRRKREFMARFEKIAPVRPAQQPTEEPKP